MTDTEQAKLEPEILPILVWPDEKLHTECTDVTEFDQELKQLTLNLFATMKNDNGIGLAAPQVGEFVNVLAIWIEQDKPVLLINPKIVEASDETFEWEEGCLSVPGYFEKRKRPNRIVVSYKTVTGDEKESEFRDLYAFAIQHEIDHLNGTLFIDGFSKFKLSRVKAKIKKYLKFK